MLTIIKLNIHAIEDDGFHLHLRVLINGKPANFLLDTGASKTVFDLGRIRHFISDLITEANPSRKSSGLGTSSMEIHRAMIESFEIGELRKQQMEGAFLDLSHVNESYRQLGIEEIDGVVGNDILHNHRAVINLKEGTLQLCAPNPDAPLSGSE